MPAPTLKPRAMRMDSFRLRSLQAKLSLVFALLLGAVSAVFFYLLAASTGAYLAEAMQRQNLHLAASIAKELRIDERTNTISPDSLHAIFDAAMVINPSIELYIVGLDGEIFAYAVSPETVKRKTVDAEKIRQLLSGTVPLPIFGDNPKEAAPDARSGDARNINPDAPLQAKPTGKVFSAAMLRHGDGQPHSYLYILLSVDGYDSALSMVRQSTILTVLMQALGISLLAAFVIGFALIGFLTQDLRGFTAFVRAIQSGNYAARIDVKPNSDLAELAQAFNDMAAKVEGSIDALTLNDRLRRDLIANVSHDLRTPLASIEGYLETILHRAHLLSDAEKAMYLHTIQKHTKSLNRLVSELFELSKLEARETVPKPEAFSASELVQDVLLKFKYQADAAGIRLVASLPTDVPFVIGDIALLERVLQNLIDNAVRHSRQTFLSQPEPAASASSPHLSKPETVPQGNAENTGAINGVENTGADKTADAGQVSVSVTRRGQGVQIVVADTGDGIAPEELPHLFDRFYRSDRVRRTNGAGLGLGLAIAKKIVELHHSDLAVESTLGDGSAFSFTLPIASPAQGNA